jgi:hypothetical protein
MAKNPALAGFQPNVKVVYEEIADFFRQTSKNLRDSLLLKIIEQKIEMETTLSLASAAAIAFSHFALPVYEIYKVGSDLYWENGLNFLESFYKKLTVVPHLNNNEGGEKTDTSYCFMGKERFEKLQKLLPKDELVWGIDENTAVIINLKTKVVKTIGKGELHILNI